MIGYDPNGLMIHMAHKQEVGDALMSCDTSIEREALETEFIEQSKAVIQEKTGIEVGSMTVVCLPSGINLMGGMRPLHNHDDPDQHITAEVTRIDCWGEIYYNDKNGEEQSTHMRMITLCGE
jgi:hypothetical protein